MRATAYVVAVLAAVGIMIGVASLPDVGQNVATNGGQTLPSPYYLEDDVQYFPAGPENQLSNQSEGANRVMSEAGTLVLSVPKMHCQYSCYPNIKKLLEATDSVREVELAEQKEDDVLDNRAVIVKYDSGFDVNAAIFLLAENGFEESDLVQ